jgi:hypothetical protein
VTVGLLPRVPKRRRKQPTARRSAQNHVGGCGFVAARSERLSPAADLTNQGRFVKTAAGDLINQSRFVKAAAGDLTNQGENRLSLIDATLFQGATVRSPAGDSTVRTSCNSSVVAYTLVHNHLTKYLIF